jgi:hypothetical protein
VNIEELHKITHDYLDYNPETGEFLWKASRGRRAKGARAGSVRSNGYAYIWVKGGYYRAHRLAWLYVHGRFPDLEIDHVNMNKTDNRIENLRLATHSQNGANTGKKRNNKSGYKGVHYSRIRKKWRAQIEKGGNKHHLGLFYTPEEAHNAYIKAAQELFGEFARAA